MFTALYLMQKDDPGIGELLVVVPTEGLPRLEDNRPSKVIDFYTEVLESEGESVASTFFNRLSDVQEFYHFHGQTKTSVPMPDDTQ